MVARMRWQKKKKSLQHVGEKKCHDLPVQHVERKTNEMTAGLQVAACEPKLEKQRNDLIAT